MLSREDIDLINMRDKTSLEHTQLLLDFNIKYFYRAVGTH